MSISEILKNRITTKCFDNIPIEQDKIDYILECAIAAPSKQGLYNYKIGVLGNSGQAREIKTWMFQSDSWCDEKGVRLGKTGRKVLNGQYNAPLVLVWMQREKDINKLEKDDSVDGNANIDYYKKGTPMHQTNETDLVDMTVSSSVAMLAAEEQGLSTGFGRCHDADKVAEKLGYPGLKAEIILGIGYGTDHDNDELPDNHYAIAVYRKKGSLLGIMSKNIPPGVPVRHRLRKPHIDKLIQHY